MPGLLIKNIPSDLHQQLAEQAERNHRSLTKEALAILENALRGQPARPPLREIDRHRVRGRKPLTETFLRRAKRTGRP